MERVKSTLELPEWFNLDKYDQFTIEDQLQLIRQIEGRSLLLSIISEEGKLDDEAVVDWEEIKHFGAIHEGDLHERWLALGDSTCREGAEQDKNEHEYFIQESEKYSNRLEESISVSAIDLMWAWNMGERAKRALPIIDDSNKDYIQIHNSAFHSRSFDLECGSGEEVHLLVRLDAPDAQILSELRRLLPRYREAIDHPEPPSIFKNKDPLKVLRYKILPLIDLQIWAKIEHKKIPYSVYQAALFRFGETGEDDIRKTIIPFIERTLSSGFTDEWRTALESPQP